MLLPDFSRSRGHGTGPDFEAFARTAGPTGFDDGSRFDDGCDFLEGSGSIAVAGGCAGRLVLTGCAPGTLPLTAGDLLQTGPGRAHLITVVLPANRDGISLCFLAPPLRAPPAAGAPVTNAPMTKDWRVAMRLTGSDTGDGATLPPARSRYRLQFEEPAV